MICPSCGYENYLPNATNCDLCHASLRPQAGEAVSAASAGGDALAAMATAVAEAEEAAEKGPAVGAASRTKGDAAAGAPRSSGPPGAPLAPLDLVLFLLAVPVALPTLVFGLAGGRRPSTIPSPAWLAGGGAMLLLGVCLALAVPPAQVGLAVALPAVFLIGGLAGTFLLVRQEGPIGYGGLALVMAAGCLTGVGRMAHTGVNELIGQGSLVSGVAFTPDGLTAISGGQDSTLAVWDMSRGEIVRRLRGHTKGVTCLTLLPGATRVASGSFDGSVRVVELGTEALVQTLEGPRNGVLALAPTPDGSGLVFGGAGGFLSFQVLGGAARALEGHQAPVYALTVSDDGARAASGSSDGALILWDLSSGEQLRRWQAHEGAVRSLAFFPDGRLLSGGDDRELRVWDPNQDEPVQRLAGPRQGVRCLVLSADRRQVFAAHTDRTLTRWDLSRGEETGHYLLPEAQLPPAAMGLTPMGRLWLADGERVRLIDLESFSTGPVG